MRISFIGKRFYTNQDALAEGFGRIVQVPLAWHRQGHSLQLLLLDYSGRRGEVAGFDGLQAESIPVKSSAFLRLSASVAAFQPDLVVASGDCFVGLIAYRISRRASAAFVFDVYDDYRTFAAYRAFLGWDALGFLSRRAVAVTCASSRMAEEVESQGPVLMMPNGVDETSFAPIPMVEARNRLGLAQEGELAGYFGTITPTHGIGILIQAVEKLRDEGRDLQLLLCGRQDPAVSIEREAVVYRGMVDHASIPLYLNACNVLALPYLHSQFLDHASSCKVAEYLFCGRPVVATDTPNFVQNFPDQARSLGDLVVSPGDPEALAQALRRQLDEPLILQPPLDMTWDRIAGRVIARLEGLLRGDAARVGATH